MIVCRCIIRIKIDGLLEINHRQAGVTKIFMGNTPSIIGLGVIRIKPDGPAIVVYSAVILEKVSMDIRAVYISSHIMRVKTQCLVIIQ